MKANQLLYLISVVVLCSGQLSAQQTAGETNAAQRSLPKDASEFTRRANRQVLRELDFQNRHDYKDALRGLVERFDGVIKDAEGKTVWDLRQYDFLNEHIPRNAPLTVNPSLWRQAQLNTIGGLFEVVKDKIYQLRGFDLSNMTLIRGDQGWIVIDPLVTEQAARYALNFANDKLGKRPVTAVIFTHSHIDHYGGVLGVTTQPDVRDGKVKIIAPDGFFSAAVNENIIVGNVMGRRASYMYGNTLIHRGPRSQVGAGLGKTTSNGDHTVVKPTLLITDATIQAPQDEVVDGVRIKFWNTPEAEAPSEMMFYFPEFNALCTSEELTHTLHNLYSLRGAKVRDSLAWSDYLADTFNSEFGKSAEVMFASHHWPTWENENIRKLLGTQRDLYKYLHDQTLRLANQGYTMIEIAEQIELPPSLAEVWANRSYYGTVNHNVKAVYQRYLGWFDANPANLHSLPPVEASRHYVEYMGGPKKILRRARKSYQRGEYRWVAMVVNHVVFADSGNMKARKLLADAYEQLGYQAESGPWRNFYLTGARELREPKRVDLLKLTGDPAPSTEELSKLSDAEYFNYVAIHMNGPQANGDPRAFKIQLRIKPLDAESKQLARFAVLRVENSVLRADVLDRIEWERSEDVSATIVMDQSLLDSIMLLGGEAGAAKFRKAHEEDPKTTTIEGTPAGKQQWYDFLRTLERFEFWFNIIEP